MLTLLQTIEQDGTEDRRALDQPAVRSSRW